LFDIRAPVRYLSGIQDVVLGRHDVIIVGAGAAGLACAVEAALQGANVCVVYEHLGATFQAQGGMAAAVGADDSVDLHIKDTISSGAGISDPEVVEKLAKLAPETVRWLQVLGFSFDTDYATYKLGLEAGHSRRRVLHAGGDSSGRQLSDFLFKKAKNLGVNFYASTSLSGLVFSGDRCTGIQIKKDVQESYLVGKAVVLATGGLSGLFWHSTNRFAINAVSQVLAHQAGAVLADLEFVQFHPTVFAGNDGESFLISETLRGEGAWIVDSKGRRFLFDVDPRGELATRDIVARTVAIVANEPGNQVFLDLRHMDPEFVRERFPEFLKNISRSNLNFKEDLVPIRPAAHYHMGGIAAAPDGTTTVPGLLACGECSCTGLHGANRLASNSIMECLSFGRLTAKNAINLSVNTLRDISVLTVDATSSSSVKATRLFEKACGIVRIKAELEDFCNYIASLEKVDVDNFMRYLMARSALFRQESRGSHFRSDFPYTDHVYEGHTIIEKNGNVHISKSIRSALGR
jgi:L-aspartate oxidase